MAQDQEEEEEQAHKFYAAQLSKVPTIFE